MLITSGESDVLAHELLIIESLFRENIIEPLTASLVDSKLPPPKYPRLVTETKDLQQRTLKAIEAWKKGLAAERRMCRLTLTPHRATTNDPTSGSDSVLGVLYSVPTKPVVETVVVVPSKS